MCSEKRENAKNTVCRPALRSVVLTLHNYVIINTDSWRDMGRMIHRRGTIAQRSERRAWNSMIKVRVRPRCVHATGIFRLSRNLYTIKLVGKWLFWRKNSNLEAREVPVCLLPTYLEMISNHEYHAAFTLVLWVSTSTDPVFFTTNLTVSLFWR